MVLSRQLYWHWGSGIPGSGCECCLWKCLSPGRSVPGLSEATVLRERTLCGICFGCAVPWGSSGKGRVMWQFHHLAHKETCNGLSVYIVMSYNASCILLERSQYASSSIMPVALASSRGVCLSVFQCAPSVPQRRSARVGGCPGCAAGTAPALPRGVTVTRLPSPPTIAPFPPHAAALGTVTPLPRQGRPS